jgi:asparagine synthase (glutamine-hydrolysing)
LPDPDAGEGTFFENIKSLVPGHFLRIEDTRDTKRLHWNFRPGTEISRPDAPDAFLDLLRDAVKLRLRSDVPFGVLLSGGLDSSTVARLAASETPHPLQCISLRYPSSSLDESHYSGMVADDPARYRIHWVTPSAENLLETIGAVVWHHDGPTPMRGRYPQWHVLKAASQYVTVVLGGQGADELLGGYDRFLWPFLRDRLDSRLPNQQSRWSLIGELFNLGQVSSGIHRLLPPLLFAALARQMRRGLRVLGGSRGAADIPRSIAEGPNERPYRSRLNNALWRELRMVGLPEVLHAEDSLSMAFSLEARLPFLDHRLVEFCFSLAYEEKIGGGWTKLLLRRATPGILPEPVRLRRHKLGFPGDYAGWLGKGAGLDIVRGLLLDRRTLERGWQDRNQLQQRFGRSRRRAERWVMRNPQQTWRAVTLEVWCRQFLDRDHSLRPRLSERSRNAERAASVVALADSP